MALKKDQKQALSKICPKILDALNRVAQKAQSGFERVSSGSQSNTLVGGTNTMVDGDTALINLNDIRTKNIDNLKRLEHEPFVARVVVRWEDEEQINEEVLYISRSSVAGISDSEIDGKLVTYTSPVGRIAEFTAGDSEAIQIGPRRREFTILERVRLRPVCDNGQWDAVDDAFEFDEPWSIALKSLRQFLEQLGYTSVRDEDIVDVVGSLFQQEAEGKLVSEILKRKVIERIALRDQPILDQYQGEIFRLPLNKRLLMLGPPGTGKTTTLIRRLAQKRISENFTEEEINTLSAIGLAEAFQYSDSWAMFSPTELLKLYLRDSFNNERIPASERNLKTWEKERLFLAKNVFGILRSAESKGFHLKEHVEILSDTSNAGICELYEEFTAHFEAEVLRRCMDSYKYLQLIDNDELRKRTSAAMGRRRNTDSMITVTEISSLLEQSSHLQPELERLGNEITNELSGFANRLFVEHKSLLDELVEKLPVILNDNIDEMNEVDEVDEDDEDANLLQPRDSRNVEQQKMVALKLLLSTLRKLARSVALGRSEVGGRAGKLVKFLGNRTPSTESLSNLGNRILTMTHIRTLIKAPQMFVMDPPKIYSRFRRQLIREGLFFKTEASSSVKHNRISPEETDILILTILRNARRLFAQSPTSLSRQSNQDWLENIKSQYLMQVFVDEATDFSAIQLACTMELSHPRLRSWFACGDFDQRITSYGVRNLNEIAWLEKIEGDSIETRNVNILYRQSYRLKKLAAALSTHEDYESKDFNEHKDEHDADIYPLLAENCIGDSLATWLADRIIEIENALGKLPSIAVFVDGEDKIDPIVNLVQPLLDEYNIPIVGCRDGRVVGDELEVRVFDLRHIKGLEFEAVFFVGIDDLSTRLPELFERFFYVGVSRAATYLGLTCNGQMPAKLEHIREHFSIDNWLPN